MVIGNVLQQLYNVVDSIIVGQFLGKEALAAVGASFPIFYALIAFVIGIGSGATVIISQYFGARDYEKVRLAIGTTYIFVFLASIVLTLGGVWFSREIFTLLKVGEDVMPQAISYFTIYMSGLVVFFGFNSTASILRGLGDSKTPLLFLSISTVTNILLDLLFIVVFKWGIAGAAYATIASQGLAFIISVIYLNNKKHLIHFSRSTMKFDPGIFRQSLRIGLPTGFQQTFVALGMMALIRIINNFDTSVLAAYTAASRIDSLASMPAMNLASALSAFVGQNLGAGKINRIKKGLKMTLYMSGAISLVVMAVVILFGKSLIALFNSDTEVIGFGQQYLIIVSSFYLIFSTMFVIHGTLRGAGDTVVPMFITLISLWVVRIPLALLFSHHFGVAGIWWSIPAGWSIGLLGSFIYYQLGYWKKKRITGTIQEEK
jgi:putative MATE family efflux protein